jgi:hypothetical protein
MKLLEFLTETGNQPAPFELEDEGYGVWGIRSGELGLWVYLTRVPDENRKANNMVVIEFSVHGRLVKTGEGNAVKILSTVNAILEKYLHSFLNINDQRVSFGADRKEPSRIKLYNRCIPEISRILGKGWQYTGEDESGTSVKRYDWVRRSPLREMKVESTWITDIRHSRAKKEVIVTVSSGRRYLIPGVTRAVFDQWIRWPSKGKFYHNRIKGKYQLTRIE